MEEIITKSSPELEYDFQTSEVSWNDDECELEDIFGPNVFSFNSFNNLKIYEIPVE